MSVDCNWCRLVNTKGLETLVLLEHLDISENLIEMYALRVVGCVG